MKGNHQPGVDARSPVIGAVGFTDYFLDNFLEPTSHIQALTSSEVQLGQRVAIIAMVLKQNGHSLVVGSAGGATSFRRMLLIGYNQNGFYSKYCKYIVNTKQIRMFSIIKLFCRLQVKK